MNDPASSESMRSERVSAFLDDPHRILPPKPFDAFLERVRARMTTARYESYLLHLKETKYREIYDVLFAPEQSLVTRLNAAGKGVGLGFYRSKADIASYSARGMSPLDFTERYVKQEATLSVMLTPENVPRQVRTVCEVGGAWGSTMKYLMERFRPEKYFNYEIDGGYAKWTADTFGSITMPTDGETLTGIADGSIDIVACKDVLPWIPPIKAFSYFSEFARVLRPGGIAFFNVLVAERVTKQRAATLLNEGFPRRAYAHVPRHFIVVNFPPPAFSVIHESAPNDETDKVNFVIRRN